jgi:hypothetical protein
VLAHFWASLFLLDDNIALLLKLNQQLRDMQSLPEWSGDNAWRTHEYESTFSTKRTGAA